MSFLLVCRSNGCVVGREDTPEKAQEAARTQGCGYCDGHLRVDLDYDPAATTHTKPGAKAKDKQ